MPPSSPPPGQESATPLFQSDIADTTSLCDNGDTMACSSLHDSLNLVLSSDESFSLSLILSPPPGYRDNDSSMEFVPQGDPILLSDTELVPPPEFGDGESMDTSLLDISIEMDPDDPMLESLQELVPPPDENVYPPSSQQLVHPPAGQMDHNSYEPTCPTPAEQMQVLVPPPGAQMQESVPPPGAQMQELVPPPGAQMQESVPPPVAQMQELLPPPSAQMEKLVSPPADLQGYQIVLMDESSSFKDPTEVSLDHFENEKNDERKLLEMFHYIYRHCLLIAGGNKLVDYSISGDEIEDPVNGSVALEEVSLDTLYSVKIPVPANFNIIIIIIYISNS